MEDDEHIARAFRARPAPPPFGAPDVEAIITAGLSLRTHRRRRLALAGTGVSLVAAVIGLGLIVRSRATPSHRLDRPISLGSLTVADLRFAYLPTRPFPVVQGSGNCPPSAPDRTCWAPAASTPQAPGAIQSRQVNLRLHIYDGPEYSKVASQPPDAVGETKRAVTLASGPRAVLEVTPGVVQVYWIHDGQTLLATGVNLPATEVLRFASSISDQR